MTQPMNIKMGQAKRALDTAKPSRVEPDGTAMSQERWSRSGAQLCLTFRDQYVQLPELGDDIFSRCSPSSLTGPLS
jgi:hypothetical protein